MPNLDDLLNQTQELQAVSNDDLLHEFTESSTNQTEVLGAINSVCRSSGDPNVIEEAIQRINDSTAVLLGQTVQKSRKFSLDPRDWKFINFIPAIIGSLFMLGLAINTADPMLRWFKINDTYGTPVVLLWVIMFMIIGFYLGGSLFQWLKSRRK